MMQDSLFLQRLRIVTLENKIAYDEQFHKGVNIIRGQNSSGKSTIIRFIFFALGGSYRGRPFPNHMRVRALGHESKGNGWYSRFVHRRHGAE